MTPTIKASPRPPTRSTEMDRPIAAHTTPCLVAYTSESGNHPYALYGRSRDPGTGEPVHRLLKVAAPTESAVRAHLPSVLASSARVAVDAGARVAVVNLGVLSVVRLADAMRRWSTANIVNLLAQPGRHDGVYEKALAPPFTAGSGAALRLMQERGLLERVGLPPLARVAVVIDLTAEEDGDASSEVVPPPPKRGRRSD